MKKKISGILLVVLILSCFALPIVCLAAQSVPNAVLDAAKSVVRITCEDDEYYYTGSGFVIASGSDGTYIATNQHVIEGDIYNLEVWTDDYDNVAAEIVKQDANRDIAILKLKKNYSLPVICIADKDASRGDDVYAIGFPAAADDLSDTMAYGSEETTITGGIISAIRELTLTSTSSRSVKLLQIDAAINSGNSGGPLVNRSGQVIGINTYGIDDAPGIYGAISVDELITMAKKADVTLTYASSLQWVMYAAAGLVAVIILIVIIASLKKHRAHKKAAPFSSVPLPDYIAANGALSAYSAAKLLMAIANQLRDMHEHGTLCLNLCPEAIQITGGKAEINEAVNITMPSGYTPPEVYRGRNAGAASDVYSFFALLLYACTGKTPENALDRVDWGHDAIVPESLAEEDAEFAAVLEKGLSLNPEDRYQNMQEVISALLPFATMGQATYTRTSRVSGTMSRSKTSKKKYRARKKFPVWLRVCVIVVIVIILAGAAYGYYAIYLWNQCIDALNDYDFYLADETLKTNMPFAKFIMQKKGWEEKLPQYIEAGIAYQDGDYRKAVSLFSNLDGLWEANLLIKDAVFLRAKELVDDNGSIGLGNAIGYIRYWYPDEEEEMTQEITYYCAVKQIENGEYADAINTLNTIPLYEQAEQAKDEALYQLSWEYFDDEEYLKSCNCLEQISGYLDADELLVDMRDVLYGWAIEEYEAGNHDKNVTNAFSYLEALDDADYAMADEFLLLCDAWTKILWKGENCDEIFDLIGFEDTEEVIYRQQWLMKEFLEGYWLSSGGSYYIEMSEDGYFSCSFPRYPSGDYYYIVDGVYKVGDTEETATDYLDMYIIDKNTLYIYNCRNGDEYYMYRQ